MGIGAIDENGTYGLQPAALCGVFIGWFLLTLPSGNESEIVQSLAPALLSVRLSGEGRTKSVSSV